MLTPEREMPSTVRLAKDCFSPRVRPVSHHSCRLDAAARSTGHTHLLPDMSSTAEIRQELRGKSLFREFTDAELAAFVDLLDPRESAAGELIVRQDEIGNCMFIVIKGRARVVHHNAGEFVELATIKAGDFFGELSLVDRGPRSADVQALEPCLLLRIDIGAISALAGVYPTAGFKVLIAIGRILVDRLRQSNQRYIDSLLFPLAGKD